MNLCGKDVAVWNGVFSAPVSRHYRISVCTTCMGRLTDLTQTLLQNIADNRDYPNLEFVILDYNSNDGLGRWVQENLAEHLESGLVAYFRTTEPQFYSMSHSRNLAFLAATGDIVNNVDADNWICRGFASYLNSLANQQPEKAVFSKGKRLLRGRIGFFKSEFIELGGYDERFDGYGHDDKDLFYRALLSGYTLMWYGGRFVRRLKTSRVQKVENMKNKHRKQTEEINKSMSEKNLAAGCLRANDGLRWGAAHLVKNFTEELEVGRANP